MGIQFFLVDKQSNHLKPVTNFTYQIQLGQVQLEPVENLFNWFQLQFSPGLHELTKWENCWLLWCLIFSAGFYFHVSNMRFHKTSLIIAVYWIYQPIDAHAQLVQIGILLDWDVGLIGARLWPIVSSAWAVYNLFGYQFSFSPKVFKLSCFSANCQVLYSYVTCYSFNQQFMFNLLSQSLFLQVQPTQKLGTKQPIGNCGSAGSREIFQPSGKVFIS